MPTFAQIYDAYRASPASNRLSLGEFAKLGEFYTGDPGFSTASGGLVDQGLKRGSYWLDKGVEATGAPELTGEIGSRLYGALGLEESAGREVGRGLPRMAANLLPLAIPGVGPVAAIGSSAALSGVDAYEKSDSLGSAATAAASVPVSVLGAGLATQGLSKVLGMSVPAIAQTMLGRLGLYGAENVGATAAGEAFQVATGGEMPRFDKEYLAQTALESLPFAAADVKTLFTKPAMPVNPVVRQEALDSLKSVSDTVVADGVVEKSAPAAKPANPVRTALDSVMEEFNLIDSQSELEKQTILATVPEGAEREAELLKLNKRTRQKLMRIEEPEEASAELPSFKGAPKAVATGTPDGGILLSWEGGSRIEAKLSAEAQGYTVSSDTSIASNGVTKHTMRVWKKAPEMLPAVAELPVNAVEPEPEVIQPELPVDPLAGISLVHHTTDPTFELVNFDTARQTYTPELGKGIYLDPGSGWADHVEEMRGKPSRALPARLKPGARLFKGTVEEAQRDYQNNDQFDAALIYLPSGKLDQVHVKNLSVLDSSVPSVEGAADAVSSVEVVPAPAQVLTPPVAELRATKDALVALNKIRAAAKLPPVDLGTANKAMTALIEAHPEKSVEELLLDWTTANLPRRVEEAENQQRSMLDATRAGSVNLANDPGKFKFEKAMRSSFDEVEVLSKADPKSEDGLLWSALTKKGIGWLTNLEQALPMKDRNRAGQSSTAQERAPYYAFSQLMAVRRSGKIWREGGKHPLDVSKLSPDAFAEVILQEVARRSSAFKKKKDAAGNDVSLVQLDDPELNAAQVEFEISASAEERAATEAVNDALLEADLRESVEEPTSGDPLGLEGSAVDQADALNRGDALVRQARYALGGEVGNLSVAWMTRVKSQFTPAQRAQMAETLGVPENKLSKALVDGISFTRGSDGKIRAVILQENLTRPLSQYETDLLDPGVAATQQEHLDFLARQPDERILSSLQGQAAMVKILGELNIFNRVQIGRLFLEAKKRGLNVPEAPVIYSYLNAPDDNAGTALWSRGSDGKIRAVSEDVLAGLAPLTDGMLGANKLPEDGFVTKEWLRMFGGRDGKPLTPEAMAKLEAARPEAFGEKVDVVKLTRREEVSDVGSPTFDALFTRVMRKSGEHDDTIRAMLPKIREIGKLWSLDDVRFGELVNDVMGDMPVAGMATISGPVRKMWLAARNAGLGGADKVQNLLAVAAHEAGHLAEQLYTSGAMREMDRAKYESAQRWKDTATPEEMRETLEVAVETLLPKKWRGLKEVKDMLTHTNKDEILASLHGVWALSKLENVKDTSLLGALMPAQPRGFLEMLTRIARRAMRGLQGVFYGTKSHDAHAALKQLTKNFESIEWGIKKSNEDIAAARAFLDLGVDSFDEMRTSSLRVANDKSVPLSVNEFARLMAPESDVANRQGGVWKSAARAVANFIEPMSRVVEAHPKLKELGEALLNVSGDAHNNLRRLMNPLYGDSDPVTGAHKSMPKEIREVMDIAHNDKESNALINEVMLWEASNPGKRIDFSDTTGPGRDLTRRWRELPEKKRNAVSDYIARAVKSNQEGQQMILESLDYAAARLIGRKIVTRMPGLSDSAIEIAQDQITALQLAEAGLTEQALMLNQKVKDQIPDMAVWTGVLESAKAHYEGQKKLKEFFAQRPSFQSYMRIGDYVVDAFDAAGVQVRNALPAQNANEAARLEKLLQGQGLRTKVRQTTRGARFGMSEDIQSALDAIDDRLMRKLNDAFGDRVSEAEFAQFKAEFSLSGQLQQSADVHNKFNPTELGRSLAGASGIDAVEQRRQSARIIANSLAKMKAGSSFNYWKNHPKLRTVDMIPQVEKLSEAWRNYQIDDNATAAGIAQFAGVYHLGFNLPNMVAETMQPFTTVLAQATAQHGVVAATKGIAGVLKDVAGYYAKRLAGITRASEEFSKWHNNDERLMLTTLRDQGYFSRTLYNEGLKVDGGTTLAKDLQSGRKPLGIGSMAQNLGNNVMRMYELFTRHNTRIASVLGYRLARKDGADHEAAVQAAKRFVETGAYVGSRATRSLGLYGESTRGLGQLAHVLQGYNFSFLSQAARHLQRGWLMDNKQLESYGFTEADRAKARQASLMLFGTQFAAAGALGLPFAGAMTALFEKMTGQDVKASLYQWFAQQFEDDQEQGGEAADMLMRGFANTVIGKTGLPIDLGSRFAVGGLPGMSEMSGFDAGSVFGPVGGLVKTAFGAGGKASQGDLAGAATDLLPPSVRKLFDLLQHGDMTDKNGNLMGLDEREKAMYALGITPDRVRKLRDFENMVDSVSMARLRKTNRIEAELAELMDEVDPATLRAALREKADELDMSPKALGAKVAALKLKLSMPKDFRSVPTAQDSAAASSLAAALGVSFGPSREREKAQLESQIRARLGLGPLGRDRMLEARRRERLAMESPLDAYQSLP